MVGFLQPVRHEIFLFLLFAVLCTLFPFGKSCGPSEYKSAAGECCPMCNIGSIVLRDCSGDLSTTCKPCTPGTFISEPNGLPKCFTCRNCVESQGLYIQRKCTTIQDTICAVLDGYYCIDFSNLQCSHAQKHSVCKPGQETKTPGTKTSDTVCADCPHGFYSPSGLNCTKWTDCSSRNERETENGSSVKDVTCIPKRRERYGLIFAIVLTPLFYIILYLAPQSTSEYMQDLSEFSFFTQCNQNGLIKVTWIANNLPNAGGFVGDY
uniref:TNFR-Cys domain-containing protein n=1 Tax=Cyprinus carpio TaxID=7962 RepID=A0A8C1PCE2_CYPCA